MNKRDGSRMCARWMVHCRQQDGNWRLHKANVRHTPKALHTDSARANCEVIRFERYIHLPWRVHARNEIIISMWNYDEWNKLINFGAIVRLLLQRELYDRLFGINCRVGRRCLRARNQLPRSFTTSRAGCDKWMKEKQTKRWLPPRRLKEEAWMAFVQKISDKLICKLWKRSQERWMRPSNQSTKGTRSLVRLFVFSAHRLRKKTTTTTPANEITHSRLLIQIFLFASPRPIDH